MKRSAAILIVALAGAIAAAAPARAQSDPGVSRSHAWVNSTVKGERQPRGYVQYENYCSMCHGEGVGKPGTLALQAKYKGQLPALLEKRTDLTPQLIKMYVRNGISVMPIFRKTEISDADLDAICAYLTRNNSK